MSLSLICYAIGHQTLLGFEYRGLPRVVAPYCHGVSATGVPMLRAIQLRGESTSGGFGFGKLWVVADLRGLRLLDETFEPDDPKYNPDDSALAQIHCRVTRSR